MSWAAPFASGWRAGDPSSKSQHSEGRFNSQWLLRQVADTSDKPYSGKVKSRYLLLPQRMSFRTCTPRSPARRFKRVTLPRTPRTPYPLYSLACFRNLNLVPTHKTTMPPTLPHTTPSPKSRTHSPHVLRSPVLRSRVPCLLAPLAAPPHSRPCSTRSRPRRRVVARPARPRRRADVPRPGRPRGRRELPGRPV